MTHFSIQVSRKLMEIGVEDNSTQGVFVKYKPTHEWHYWVREVWYIGGGVEKGKKLVEYAQAEYFSAYTLTDIFRLMPEIAKKMGWKYICGDCARQCNEHNEESSCCDYTIMPEWKYNSHRLLDAYLKGGMDEADECLLELLTPNAT